jgi:hypothetical protein
MKETAVREPPARIAGVDARAPLFFTLNLNSSVDRAGNDETIEKTISR